MLRLICFLRELDNIFTRLCQQVDVTQRDLLESINKQLEEIRQLEKVQGQAKVLRYLSPVHVVIHLSWLFISINSMYVMMDTIYYIWECPLLLTNIHSVG